MKNLKEFKKLIKRYQTITLEEIIGAYKVSPTAAPNILTGYGDVTTCKLCRATTETETPQCDLCVYKATSSSLIHTHNYCVTGINSPTYDDIDEAETPEELLTAYRERAKHMKTILKTLALQKAHADKT